MFNQALFSIGISQFKIDGMNDDALVDCVKRHVKKEWNPTNDSIRDTVTAAKNLSRGINPEESELLRLNQVVLQEGQKVLDGMIGNPDVNTVKVNITRMWGNDGLNNDIAIPHVHRDSFLSAVYYPKADDGSIHFYSPWNDAILAHIPVGRTKNFHEYNSSYYSFDAKKGWLYLFPSMLTHYVPPTPGERISIVYDIGVIDESI